jgi:hypothetical protein
VRRHAQAHVYQRLHAAGAGPYDAERAVEAIAATGAMLRVVIVP